MRAVACVLSVLLGCGPSWREVEARRIHAKPHRPQPAFIVTADEAFLLEVTGTSATALQGRVQRAWRRTGELRVRSGEPEETAELNRWPEQPSADFVVIPFDVIHYATSSDSVGPARRATGVGLALAVVAGLVVLVAVLGAGSYK